MASPVTSAYGNGPNSLGSPVPGVDAAQEISSGAVSMPEMTIQAGREPAAAPAGKVPSDFDAHQPAPAANVPADFDSHVPSDFDSFSPPQPPAEPQSVGGVTGAYGVVSLPDGGFGVREANGSVRHLTENEKKAAHYAATALRMGGPTIGGLIGAAAGTVGGPVGEAAGAGAGGVVGGEAVHPMASFFEKLAGEKPHERGAVDRTLEAVLPAVAGPVAGSFAKSGLANVAEEGVARTVNAGSQIAAEEASKRIATADEAGGTLFKHEVNPENAAVVQGANDLKSGAVGQKAADEFKAAELSRGSKNINKLDRIFEKVGPQQTEEAAKAGDVKKGFDSVSREFEKRLSENKGRAQKIAGDQTFDLASVQEKHPDANLPGDANLATLDKLVTRAQEEANFGNLSRSADERRAGKLSRDLVLYRDTVAANVLDAAGEGKLAKQLRSDRDFYSTNIEDIRDAQARLENDPTFASKALLDKDNPRFAEFVTQILPEKERQVVAREFIDRLASPSVDREAKTINASAFEKELKSYDPKVVDAVLGSSRAELEKFLNYAKIIDKYGMTDSGAAKTALDGAAKLVTSPKHASVELMKGLAKKLFGKQPKIEDYLNGRQVAPLEVRGQKFQAPGPLSSVNPKARAAGAGAVGGAAAGTIGELSRDSK